MKMMNVVSNFRTQHQSRLGPDSLLGDRTLKSAVSQE